MGFWLGWERVGRRLGALALAALIAAGSAGWGAAAARDGERGRPDTQVVGGFPAADGWIRSIVSLQVRGDGKWRHNCGGTMLNREWVLTAAHCVVQGGQVVPARTYRAVIGAANLDQATRRQTRAVAAIHVPQGYLDRQTGWDVALMRLAAPMARQDAPGVTTVFLPVVNDPDVEIPGLIGLVAGWGRAYPSDGVNPPEPKNTRLKQAFLPVIDVAECRAVNDFYAQVSPEREFCTYFPGKDACQGDSGGPLYVRIDDANGGKTGVFVQIGVVSRGLGCALPNMPGVWTKLSAPAIQDWIVATMGSEPHRPEE